MAYKFAKNAVLIHGAVNSSNFGDVLFVKMFYKAVLEHGDIPVFIENSRFGISDFNTQETGYIRGAYDYKKADKLIYLSGGYFGDNECNTYKSLKRWIRYFPIGLLFAFKRKDIYLLGIGGAPLHSWYNRLSAKLIMNHSKLILVRDEDTQTYFTKLGVKRPIEVTADTALCITQDDLPELQNRDRIVNYIHGRKTMLLHLSGTKELDEMINRKIVPEIKHFLEKNSDRCIFLTYDVQVRNKIEDTLVYRSLKQFDPYIYQYSSAMQLCALINLMDTIVTTKLHVGIIGCSLRKSVISVPIHLYKTKRFYQRIGFSERCIEFAKLEEGILYNMLNKYSDIPIDVPKEIRILAAKNLEY